MVNIEPTGGACGAVVTEIDISNNLTDELMAHLTTALYDNRCIIIKNQDISKEAYYEFARQWGNLILHVLDYLRMPDYPEMMAIRNTEKKGKDDAIRNGTAVWHIDGSYIEDPATITMLYVKKIPKIGVETLIADMVKAYEDLDPSLKSKVDTLTAKHYCGRAQFDEDEHKPMPIRTKEQANTNEICEKPLIFKHPVSGHKSFYAVAHSPFQINGFTEKETQVFLAELKAHAKQSKFVYSHQYEVGDILIFDTLSTMHRAKEQMNVAKTPRSDNTKLLWRLSAKGISFIYKK